MLAIGSNGLMIDKTVTILIKVIILLIYFFVLLSSEAAGFQCQKGYFLLGKPKLQHLPKDFADAFNMFLSCRGLPLLPDSSKCNIYHRVRMKKQIVTCNLYKRAKTTCTYTVEYYDSSGNAHFGDVCCYVEYKGIIVAIVKKYRTVSGYIMHYSGFKLAKHVSQVETSNNICAVKLEQINNICMKVEVSGRREIFISKFPNMVERN